MFFSGWARYEYPTVRFNAGLVGVLFDHGFGNEGNDIITGLCIRDSEVEEEKERKEEGEEDKGIGGRNAGDIVWNETDEEERLVWIAVGEIDE